MLARIGPRLLVLLAMLTLLADRAAAQTAAVEPSLAAASARSPDIVILTVIPEEYRALVDRLITEPVPPSCALCVDRYSWVRTRLSASTPPGRRYEVVVGMMGEPGLTAGALAVQRAIHRFKPRYVLLVGVAGGIPSRVERGDVVIANAIWNYDYGSLDHEFRPRPDFLYRPDSELLHAALTLRQPWQEDIRAVPPKEVSPRFHSGLNGSGYKVIEYLATGFVDALFKASPDMKTVEMEGAGAAAAIEEARQQGLLVGLLMIRGISDIPLRGDKPVLEDKRDRELWKVYAADAAASFALSLIRHNWPVAPAARDADLEDPR